MPTWRCGKSGPMRRRRARRLSPDKPRAEASLNEPMLAERPGQDLSPLVMARLVPRAYAHLGSTIGLSGQDHLPAGTRYGSLACGPLRRPAPRCPDHWEPPGMRAWTTEAVSSLNRC